jgi:hypothetical protein
MLHYQAGDSWSVTFTVADASGAAANADATPVVTILRDGIVDTAGWSLGTVTNPATGRYRVAGSVPLSIPPGSLVEIEVAATIGGVSARAIIERFRLDLADVNVVQINGQPATSSAEPVAANVVQLNGVPVTSSLPAHLVPTGLDAIAVSDPGGVANMNTLPKLVVALWRRFYKKTTQDAAAFTTYADNGTTVNTTQTTTDNGTIQTVEAA